jgi:phospholipase/carboxylesterase
MPELPCKVDPLTWIGPDDRLVTETGLIHCTHIPSAATTAQPAPMVVMLHGWAGNEASMWTFKQTVPEGVAIITPRAPVDLHNDGFAWFTYQEQRFKPCPDSFTAGLEKLERFLDCLPRFYPVDPTWRVIMGFSQGAMMGNAFLYNHPGEAIGIASLAGSMPLAEHIHNPQRNLLAGLPAFVAHGTRDQVVPVEAARETREVYTALGADVTYGEYPAAHKMHVQAIKDLKIWLKRLFPAQVLNGR